LDLESVLPPEENALIKRNKAISFHCVGDSGNNGNPTYQDINTGVMESDFSNSSRTVIPSFFYHLGDVVYLHGESDKYYEQFYHSYEHYPKPILAIPGNHDGDPISDDPKDTLMGFLENFCAERPDFSKDAHGIPRDAMTQPYVYWVLDAPFMTMIGLYSNTDEYEGYLDENQMQWFVEELKSAPHDKALIVSVHHPPYSLDDTKGSSKEISKALDTGFANAGRYPPHVHKYIISSASL
jgi:acid phosphatase type 7